MNTKQVFENKRDDITGNVVCPQCGTMYRSLKDCDVIDGFVYCKMCDYLLIRGD